MGEQIERIEERLEYRGIEESNIPNVFIQKNVKKLVHKPSDTPDTLDYG